MADAITIKALQDASLDAKSLEDVVNGDEAKQVTTRLGETYPSAKKAVKTLFENGGLPAEPFATKAQMEIDGAELADGQLAMVHNDTVNNGLYVKTAGTWVKSGYDPTDRALDLVFAKTGKNLFNPNSAVSGSQVSPSQKKLIPSSVYRRSGFIRIEAGKTYALSGNLPASNVIGWFASNDDTSTAISVTSTAIAKAPDGAAYAVFNITNTGGDDTSYDGTTQFEQASAPTAYEPFKPMIDGDNVIGVADGVKKDDLYEYKSKNLIDVSKVDFVKRVSGVGFAVDTVGAAASDWMPVTEGQWYTVSGAGLFLNTGGQALGAYFSGYQKPTGVQAVSFVVPVDENGRSFKVPTGLGITHVIINLKKAGGEASATTLDGNVQLELGEIASTYQPYGLKPVIKNEFLPKTASGGSSSNATLDDAAWYKYAKADGAKIHQDKLPKFRKAMLLKDSDVVVVNSGTSLTARTSEHSTLRDDAAFRPPMMHSNAFCSHIWDALNWSGQQYRRYDASSTFTETGTFLTSSNLSEWDDGAYRDGLTRYSSDTNAAVSFTVPTDAWQFNFIYRTDSVGCEANVTIAEGAGMMQVYDDATSAWVEADNYAFSMLESAPVTRSVNVPNPITGAMMATTLASNANTTYQKRLKMRCKDSATLDSLATAKTVTISRTGGGARFMYWGVEYSPREFMISYINAARGSHKTDAASALGLPRFADNEIWSFKPTLILSELAIHNDGASGITSYQVGRWANLAKNYVTNLEFELSMFSRAAHFNLAPEYAFFTGSTPLLVDTSINGISADGRYLLTSIQTASVNGEAKAMTTLDKYEEAEQALKEENVICINAAKRWIDAGLSVYGNMRVAYAGSGNSGNSMSSDGTHWNDTGSKVMAKAVLPII